MRTSGLNHLGAENKTELFINSIVHFVIVYVLPTLMPCLCLTLRYRSTATKTRVGNRPDLVNESYVEVHATSIVP